VPVVHFVIRVSVDALAPGRVARYWSRITLEATKRMAARRSL
jgi:hypothetical protein